jgi:hypothetical protein
MEGTRKSIFQTFALFPNLEAKGITAKEQANQGCLEQRPDRQTSFRCRRDEKRTSSSRSSEPHGASKLTLHRAGLLSSPHPAMTVVSPISSLPEKEKEEAAGQKQRRHLGSAVSLYRPSSCCLLGPVAMKVPRIPTPMPAVSWRRNHQPPPRALGNPGL